MTRELLEDSKKALRACVIRQALGGVPATESSLMEKTVNELIDAGYTQEQCYSLFESVLREVFSLESN